MNELGAGRLIAAMIRILTAAAALTAAAVWLANLALREMGRLDTDMEGLQ